MARCRLFPLLARLSVHALALWIAVIAVGMVRNTEAASEKINIEQQLRRLVASDPNIINVPPADIFRYRTKWRIDLVFRAPTVLTAAVASELSSIEDPYSFSKYICAAAITRAVATENLVIDESVPYHALVRRAATQLSATSASISGLSVRKEQRAGGWLLAVCSAPRSGVTVSKSSPRYLLARAAFDVAKSLLSMGSSNQRVIKLLRIAVKNPRIRADARVIKSVLTWDDSLGPPARFSALIGQMSDRDSTIIAGAFLSAKRKWNLSADAFSRCLGVDPHQNVCQQGLTRAESQERKAEWKAAQMPLAVSPVPSP